MVIIGITGPSGSGKGTLAKQIAALGYINADADEIYHGLLKSSREMKDELVSAFGDKILTENGEIDRKTLAKAVFGNGKRRKLLKLNSITHKYVCREYVKIIINAENSNAAGVIIDAPLLIEARLDRLCDIVVGVFCPREERIRRIVSRDKISYEQAAERVFSQKGDAFYARFSDIAVQCDGTADLCKTAEMIDLAARASIKKKEPKH